MNRLAHWMMRLYPARWRRRYADEISVLVEDAGADIRMVTDLLKGAISMQLSTWSFPRLAAILGILGMLAGLGVSLFEPTRYVARSELSFAGDEVPVSTRDWLHNEILSRGNLTTVINSPNLHLYADLQRKVPLSDVIQAMRRNTVIEVGDTNKVVIQFTYPDRAKAVLAVRQMAADSVKVLERMEEVNRQSGPQRPRLVIADAASVPDRPLRPAWWRTALAGLALGLVVALLLAAANRIRSPGPVWRLALAGSLAGAALSWVIPYAPGIDARGIVPLRWESRATLYDQGTVPLAHMLVQAASRTAMAALATDPRWNLYKDASKTRTLDDVAELMRGDVAITARKPEAGLRFIDLSFTCSDRFQCPQILMTIVARLEEEYSAIALKTSPIAPLPGNATVIQLPLLSVDAAEADRRKPALIGLLAGLLFAVLFSLLRFRWTPDEDDFAAAAALQTPCVYARRFRKLAIWLATAGMAAGTVAALRAPARYTSTALVSFEGAYPQNAVTLANDAVSRSWKQVVIRKGLYGATESLYSDIAASNRLLARADRALTWRQVEAGGTKTDSFALSLMARDPKLARSVLQDLVGELDRTLGAARGTAETPYENIRGVDGVLLPVTAPEDLAPIGELYSSELVSDPRMQLVLSPPVTTPQPSVENRPASGIAVAGVASASAADEIPYDDARARPRPEPAYRTLKMNVIDTPSLPSHAEGLGWWNVAIGIAAGLALAAFLSLFGGFGSGLPVPQSSTVADPFPL